MKKFTVEELDFILNGNALAALDTKVMVINLATHLHALLLEKREPVVRLDLDKIKRAVTLYGAQCELLGRELEAGVDADEIKREVRKMREDIERMLDYSILNFDRGEWLDRISESIHDAINAVSPCQPTYLGAQDLEACDIGVRANPISGHGYSLEVNVGDGIYAWCVDVEPEQAGPLLARLAPLVKDALARWY